MSFSRITVGLFVVVCFANPSIVVAEQCGSGADADYAMSPRRRLNFYEKPVTLELLPFDSFGDLSDDPVQRQYETKRIFDDEKRHRVNTWKRVFSERADSVRAFKKILQTLLSIIEQQNQSLFKQVNHVYDRALASGIPTIDKALDEITGIAEVLAQGDPRNLAHFKNAVTLFNLLFDQIINFDSTVLIVQNTNNETVVGRTVHFHPETLGLFDAADLKKLLIHVSWVRRSVSPNPEYSGITLLGHVGLISAVRHGESSYVINLNFRHPSLTRRPHQLPPVLSPGQWSLNLNVSTQKTRFMVFPGLYMRVVVSNAYRYIRAVFILYHTPLRNDAFFSIAGPKPFQARIITRSPLINFYPESLYPEKDRFSGIWFLVENSMDWWERYHPLKPKWEFEENREKYEGKHDESRLTNGYKEIRLCLSSWRQRNVNKKHVFKMMTEIAWRDTRSLLFTAIFDQSGDASINVFTSESLRRQEYWDDTGSGSGSGSGSGWQEAEQFEINHFFH